MKTIEEADTKELVKIIRNLMAFIVVDGKDCIDKDNEKLQIYVSKYLILFAKVLNKSAGIYDPFALQKLIETDIDWIKEKHSY